MPDGYQLMPKESWTASNEAPYGSGNTVRAHQPRGPSRRTEDDT